MKIGLIGNGAIASYVLTQLSCRGKSPAVILVRPERVPKNPSIYVGAVDALPGDLDLMIDCAGHGALASHGPAILARGINLITVSLGALADARVHRALERAAQEGGSTLHLASGAIGALDCLSAARSGGLTQVTYTGRKPPQSWKGSPAEQRLALDDLMDGAAVHFEGSARQAALEYPKNANVAAAVAFAGLGFDKTMVRLIADASVTHNIHEIEASGAFGSFSFRISGNSLPDNPKSSALAAMSVLSKVNQLSQRIVI
jgi:aspartate dehydrogenase